MDSAEIFLERSRYYLSSEYLPKIRQCVAAMPAEMLWHRANESSNSVGNLLMHLAGNVREWIVGGIGGRAVVRDRPREFATREGLPAAALIADLNAAIAEADEVLGNVSVGGLARRCTIQSRETTVIAAIYHVVEHFAMHTGQIVLLTKERVPEAIHFYDDSDGAARPLWGGREGIRQI